MIRIIGDRLSGEIKAALLHTIGLLIAKAGPGLKPFVPQLQTTFLKCLGDQACCHSTCLNLLTLSDIWPSANEPSHIMCTL